MKLVVIGLQGFGVYLPSTAVLAAKSGGNCSYEALHRTPLVEWCASQNLGRIGGGSCPDLCKRRGCADYNPVLNGSWPIIDRP